MVLDQKRLFINTFQTILRSVCLLVVLQFCTSFVVFVLVPAYTSLCRGLDYLLKVRYIIVVVLNGSDSMIFSTFFCYGMEILPYVAENTSQKRAAFAFSGTYHHQTFTECVSN